MGSFWHVSLAKEMYSVRLWAGLRKGNFSHRHAEIVTEDDDTLNISLKHSGEHEQVRVYNSM